MQTDVQDTAPSEARLWVDPNVVAQRFDRLPFGFDHNLGGLDMFSFASLRSLAEKYEDDFFVAASAPSPQTPFYSVSHGRYSPLDAIARLESVTQRVLLKRPERYDARFADLLQIVFNQILEMRGGLRGERVVRLVSGLFISSAAATTPFHFDPETTFFFQIEGRKEYHLYPPTALTEPELESFYRLGRLDIGQVDLEGRDRRYEHVFQLTDGKGMHQPQNCPHWVITSETRSVSYTISFETNVTRARGRTRAFNYYMRRAGLSPSPLDVKPTSDWAKARTMQYAIPIRRAVGRAVRFGRA
jgi:hypothetical protein